MKEKIEAKETNGDQKVRILAVDDDRAILLMLTQELESRGYEVITAKNGKEACSIIAKEFRNISCVILDREMPKMDGISVLKWIRKNSDYNKIPIIMQTGSNRPDQIQESINAGIFYYLNKPIEQELLDSILNTAIRDSSNHKILHNKMRSHKHNFKIMNRSNYTINSLEEAEDLACFLANCFPNAACVLSGLAELLINAIEHGNLNISYDEKTELINKGTWRDEVIKRCELDSNKNKKVQVFYKKTEEAYMVKIIDEGDGFDWQKFMAVDPNRITDNHGHGIAQANMLSFDRIKYNNKGNEVVASVFSHD